MRSNSKRANCKRHFKRRAKERYGLDINQKDLKRIIRMIQKGRCEILEKQSNRVTVYEVNYKGERMPVAYDHNRGVPITALPQDDCRYV